ncbi:hypothetical protein D9M68_668210 [compost metagenome]
MVGVVVAAGDLAGDAVVDRIVHWAVHVDAKEGIAIVVVAGLHIGGAPITWPLADETDDAARIGATIEHRSRPFQHLDALQHERIDLKTAETVGEKIETIEEDAGLRRIEAADVEPVGIRIDAEGLGHHARRIAKRLVDLVDDAAIVQLVAADDRYRLRDFVDRGGRLRAGGCRLGDIAVDRTGCVVCGRSSLDLDLFQPGRRRVLRHRGTRCQNCNAGYPTCQPFGETCRPATHHHLFIAPSRPSRQSPGRYAALESNPYKMSIYINYYADAWSDPRQLNDPGQFAANNRPCARRFAQANRLRFHCAGVVPTTLRKTRVKCAWSENPVSTAIAVSDASFLSRSCLARSTRVFVCH